MERGRAGAPAATPCTPAARRTAASRACTGLAGIGARA